MGHSASSNVLPVLATGQMLDERNGRQSGFLYMSYASRCPDFTLGAFLGDFVCEKAHVQNAHPARPGLHKPTENGVD